MTEAKNILDKAKSVKDFSDIGFECGCYFNPIGNFSLLPWGVNWLASFRVFGYYITTDIQNYVFTKSMRLQHPDEHIFCLLDSDFNLVRRLPLAENTYYKPEEFRNNPTYLEDGRMVQWKINGRPEIYFISSTFYISNGHYDKMGLEVQHLKMDYDGIHATHIWNSTQANIKGRQKNWMAVPDKPFNYIATTSENGTWIADIGTRRLKKVGNYDLNTAYRGNSPLLKTEDGYMTLAHTLDFDDQNRKRYLNYLICYNKDLSVKSISKPFKFTDMNIEFTTTFLEDGDDFLIGVTIFDETPLLLRYGKDDFLSIVSKE